MQIDIPAHIEKLLFLHNSLIIPGFGGFTATVAPAKADFSGGTVTPPSKILTFSENLVVDDGRLTQDIANTHGITTEEAQQVVASFVEKMQVLLNQREIVTLPNIGRLYKNYMQKIQFLPDATNFNAASYGLPPLQFSPLSRSREVTDNGADAPGASTITATAPPLPPPPPPVVSVPQGKPAPATVDLPPMPQAAVASPPPQVIAPTSTRIFPYIAGLILLAAVALGFWRWRKLEQTEQKTAKNDMEQSVNTALKGSKTDSESDTKDAAPVKPKPTINKTPSPTPAKETPSKPVTGKGERECILIAATLSSETNAEKLINTLENRGFEVYAAYKGGHQIGIRFMYTDPDEVQKNMRSLQAITGEKPVVKKR